MSHTVTELTRTDASRSHPPLTRDERQLLAAVNRHRRTTGWSWCWAGLVSPAGTVDVDWWSYHRGDRTTLQITAHTPYGANAGSICSAEVGTVQQAVDVAVTFGLLPVAFSSGYRAGLAVERHTARLALRADQVDVGWLLLDASNEIRWHRITAVLDCDIDHPDDMAGEGCVVIVSSAYCGGEAHMPPGTSVDVQVPAEVNA